VLVCFQKLVAACGWKLIAALEEQEASRASGKRPTLSKMFSANLRSDGTGAVSQEKPSKMTLLKHG